MRILKIFRSRIVLFIIQFAILSLFLIIFKYSFTIVFDSSVSEERKVIIQVLVNYIMFEGANDTIFIYSLRLLVATIPIILYRKVKKVYSINLLSFFFPNFFFYVFLSRYSPLYFNENFGQLFIKTVILGAILIVYSVGFSLIINRIWNLIKKEKPTQLLDINKKIVSQCPKCGTRFDSKPLYCYNCNAKLIDEKHDK